MIKKLEYHPASNLFPLMNGVKLLALVEDIRKHGLLNSIELYDGMILDGRNRYQACLKAGIEPETINVDEDVKCPYLHVASLNLLRRHLTDDQRVAIAAEIVEAQAAIAKRDKATKAGKAGGVGRKKENSSEVKTTTKLNSKPKERIRAKVAKEKNVSESKLRDVAAIKKADPEMPKKIAAGEVTIKQAKKKVGKKKQNKQKTVPTVEKFVSKLYRDLDKLLSPKDPRYNKIAEIVKYRDEIRDETKDNIIHVLEDLSTRCKCLACDIKGKPHTTGKITKKYLRAEHQLWEEEHRLIDLIVEEAGRWPVGYEGIVKNCIQNSIRRIESTATNEED